ncbi:MAG: hypothetical protein ABSF08_06755 [Candidatus Cybelea sp.]
MSATIANVMNTAPRRGATRSPDGDCAELGVGRLRVEISDPAQCTIFAGMKLPTVAESTMATVAIAVLLMARSAVAFASNQGERRGRNDARRRLHVKLLRI